MNIVDLIRQETSLHQDKLALVESPPHSRSITYRDLLAKIAALSALLAARAIGPGQRIGFRCADGIDYVIGALALLEAGAAVVPVTDSLTPAEIADTLSRIDTHGILTHTNMPRTPDDSAAAPLDATFSFQPRPTNNPDLDARCRDLHAAFIRFSSGTTGESKGVLLSHQSIRDRTDAANDGLAITHADTILWVLAMSHHFVVSILLFLRQGATIIVANNNFPFSVLEAAQQHPITFIYGSPVHYYLLAVSDAVAPTALSQVRLAISTAMKMPADISTEFTQKFHLSPAEAYGIIEIGLPFINTENRLEAGSQKLEVGSPPTSILPSSTVGRILPAYQLQIKNPDEGGVGDVLIKGPGMFDAYVSPWRTRDQCLTDGYFATGDLGRLDDAGRLQLLGRTKTVIVHAGMKIFPEEVEEILNSAPGIAASLVSARPHPQFGQVPIAQVILKPNAPPDTLTTLRAHCLKQLSSYKVPIEFTAVASLPKTPSGKLARNQ